MTEPSTPESAGAPRSPAISAEDINPRPLPRRTGITIFIILLVFGIALALSGIGTITAIAVANSTSNTIDVRGKARDIQTRNLINRLNSQQEQIKTLTDKNTVLTNQVAANQAKNVGVLCAAVISSEEQALHDGRQTTTQVKNLVGFLVQYGCKVPPDLSNL